MAITADICTRNYHQEFITSCGLPLEHPRAGTTDDVECFFSVLRDVVGKDFTLKQECPLVLYMLYSRKFSSAITSFSTYAGLVWMEEDMCRVCEV